MLKKLLAVSTVLGLAAFSVATTASAEGEWFGGDTTTNVSVSNKSSAYVKTEVDTKAKTGGNDANATSNSNGGSSRAKGGWITTGAANAWTGVGVVVNTNWTLINHP
ncbi:MAG: hypothetical protein HYY50_04540 [Candidatus Kerfeldbacteria bacterium]|nr:hypothetical protein [Candidatus Kerfeldbacteria bacterium]